MLNKAIRVTQQLKYLNTSFVYVT